MRFVLDPSAIVPLIHEEDQTKNAFGFSDLCHKHGVDLAISPLVRCEVGNCVVQFAKRENIDASRYLEMFMGIRFRMIPIGVAIPSSGGGIPASTPIPHDASRYGGGSLL